MSRNFYEYKVADVIGDEPKKSNIKKNNIDPRVLEELEALNGLIPGL